MLGRCAGQDNLQQKEAWLCKEEWKGSAAWGVILGVLLMLPEILLLHLNKNWINVTV